MSRRARFVTRLSLLPWLAALIAGPALGQGTITGTVKYEGRVPNLRPLKLDGDPMCAQKHSEAVRSELVVLGPDNSTLANVFVSVKSGLPERSWPAPATPAVMDQDGCIYKPHVIGVMVGQDFVVKNSDGILHNVHSLSKINTPFNRAMPGSVKESTYTFDKEEGMFKLKCDVHPWMGAYVGVMKHPFFDVTGTDGKYTIEGLPPGTYEIEAWHEFDKFPAQIVTVTIGNGESKSADFTFVGPSD